MHSSVLLNLQILALSCFEETDIIAVVEVGEFVQLVEFRLCVEFCVFSTVWHERVEVIEKMSVSVGDAARTEEEYSLFVFLYAGRSFNSVLCARAAF